MWGPPLSACWIPGKSFLCKGPRGQWPRPTKDNNTRRQSKRGRLKTSLARSRQYTIRNQATTPTRRLSSTRSKDARYRQDLQQRHTKTRRRNGTRRRGKRQTRSPCKRVRPRSNQSTRTKRQRKNNKLHRGLRELPRHHPKHGTPYPTPTKF